MNDSAHGNAIDMAVLSEILCQWHFLVEESGDAEHLAMAYREMAALAMLIAEALEGAPAQIH